MVLAMIPTTNWHKKVYKKRMPNKSYSDEWLKLKIKCLKRDHYTCQRCEKINSQGRGLTVHHIIPRIEGGPDEIHNLITLCDSCHDYVEVNELRSIAAIEGSYDGGVKMPEEKTEELNDEGYHFTRPAWHKFVYGSKRHEH